MEEIDRQIALDVKRIEDSLRELSQRVMDIQSSISNSGGSSDDSNFVRKTIPFFNLDEEEGGGGGGTEDGFTGYKPVVVRLEWNEDGEYKLKAVVVNYHYINGRLQDEEYEETKVLVFDTTPHSEVSDV